MQKLFRSLIAVGSLAGLAACGDDVSITEPPPPPLTISGAPVTAVSVGAKVQLSASEAVTWTSSAANVASVDGTGLVTAVAAGTASITATSTADVSRKASVTITVTAPAVRNVTVSPANAILKPGETQGFVANVDADAGVARTVTWTSSTPSVATVTAAGVVTAVAPGATTITATSTANTSVSGAASVTVRAPLPATISIQNITVTGNQNATVNVNNVAGSIDVNLNVDPGEQVVQRVEVLIDGNVACTQNLSGAQSEAMRLAAAFEELEAVIVSCQINTAAFSATTGIANFFNGSHTLSARAVLVGGTDVATPSTPLIFNNTSGVIAVVTNTNGTDPAAAINPGTGIQWIGGGITLTVTGVSYVSGTTVSSVSCTIVGKTANIALTNGTGSVTYTEGSSAWTAGNSSVTNYLSVAGGETANCQSAVLSNGQPLPNPGTIMLNFGPFPGQTSNAAMPVLQILRLDNTAPGVTSANGVAQVTVSSLVVPMVLPWVNAAATLTPSATGSGTNVLGLPSLATLNSANAGVANDVEEGVDAITVSVFVPAAGGALPTTGGSCNVTGLTSVTTGSQLAETTVSTAYPLRYVFRDALGNQTCFDHSLVNPTAIVGVSSGPAIGVDFVTPTIVSVAGPAANSFFTSQAAMIDFSFSVTDNASGFAAFPVNARIVRLDSVNTAFCVLGSGSSCAAKDTALVFDPTKTLTASGYYTITYAVKDQAGNITATTTLTYLLDQTAPTWTGGVSLPSVIAGATTNTFTATPNDNLDLGSVFGVVTYPTANIQYPSQSLGSYGPPLEKGGTAIGYAVNNWIRCLNPAGDFATTTNQPSVINLTVSDQAGNTATVPSPAFGPNAQPCGAVAGGAAAFNSFGPLTVTLGAGKTEVDIDGATMATTSQTTADLQVVADVPVNTTADPFTRVEFYYVNAAGNLQLAGTATGVLAQTPTTRTYTYKFTWDPDANVPSAALPGAAVNLVAIGVDAQGDAVMSNAIGAVSVLIVP